MEALVQACQELNQQLPPDGITQPAARHLKKNPHLIGPVHRVKDRLHSCGEVYRPAGGQSASPPGGKPLKAVAWNIERGKNFASLTQTIDKYPELRSADLLFLTEVDWGMARSENRNVTAELGRQLGCYAYFAPSYFNFTKGHGVERGCPGRNELGLHGKSILSRYPLMNLRVVPMPNATDKFTSKEARLGQKRALVGDLRVGNETLTVACTHLDAFSSPKTRSRQLAEVSKACHRQSRVLLGGDWNTNTLDSTNTPRIISKLLYQLIFFGPSKMVQHHFLYPERHFDRPIFQVLQQYGFETEPCNEPGKGTYNLFPGDQELGEMANDQFPLWALKYIDRLIQKAGGNIGMKLDWFATKGLLCHHSRVLPLAEVRTGGSGPRASDHYPIYLEFEL